MTRALIYILIRALVCVLICTVVSKDTAVSDSLACHLRYERHRAANHGFRLAIVRAACPIACRLAAY